MKKFEIRNSKFEIRNLNLPALAGELLDPPADLLGLFFLPGGGEDLEALLEHRHTRSLRAANAPALAGPSVSSMMTSSSRCRRAASAGWARSTSTWTCRRRVVGFRSFSRTARARSRSSARWSSSLSPAAERSMSRSSVPRLTRAQEISASTVRAVVSATVFGWALSVRMANRSAVSNSPAANAAALPSAIVRAMASASSSFWRRVASWTSAISALRPSPAVSSICARDSSWTARSSSVAPGSSATASTARRCHCRAASLSSVMISNRASIDRTCQYWRGSAVPLVSAISAYRSRLSFAVGRSPIGWLTRATA